MKKIQGAKPPATHSASGKGQQSYLSGPLDGNGYLALMLGTVTGGTTRQYLAPVRNKPSKLHSILVTYGFILIGTENAHLAARSSELAFTLGHFVSSISLKPITEQSLPIADIIQ